MTTPSRPNPSMPVPSRAACDAPFHAYCECDRDHLPKLLLDLAAGVAEWPVGPLQLRLAVPDQFRAEIEQAANASTLKARCATFDD